MGVVRFVLVSHLRSGTHMLRTALESHPRVRCQSEPFNSDDRQLPYPLSTPTAEILDRHVWNAELEAGRDAVGFVLHAFHPWGLVESPRLRQNPAWGDVWDRLARMDGLRVIHLRRANALRRALSLELARRREHFHIWDPARVGAVTHLRPAPSDDQVGRRPPEAGPLRLDPTLLRASFEEVERHHADAERRLAGRPRFDVTYEELVSDRERIGGAIQEFLGLDPRPLEPATRRIETRPLREAIEDFAELARHFEGTRWAPLFAQR